MKNIYIRDAGVIKINSNNKYFSKKEFFLRLSNAIKLALKLSLNLQITVNNDFFLKNMSKFFHFKKKLKKINRILIHLHTRYNSLIKKNDKTYRFVDSLNRYADDLRNVMGYCIHPDNVSNYQALEKLIKKKRYLAIEVTDIKSKSGNKVTHIRKLLKKYKFLRLVLDTSHISQVKKKYKKEPNLNSYFSEFKSKIVEIQISSDENLYPKNLFSKNFSTDHSLLTLSKSNIYDEMKSIKNLNKKNLVIEGVVPLNNYGYKLLKKEIKLFKKIR